MPKPSRESIRELADSMRDTITLDGMPAEISHWRDSFPIVRALDPSGSQAEFSIDAVHHVLCDPNHPGAFRTGGLAIPNLIASAEARLRQAIGKLAESMAIVDHR